MKRGLFLIAGLALLTAGAPAAANAAPPAGPTGIALAGSVELAWQPAVGASAYTVYRGTTANAINTQVTPPGGVVGTSFADTGAVNGTTYYYAVRAVIGGVESANSLTVQAIPRARSCSSGNTVVLENCYPGDTTWDVRIGSTMANGGIEGFATKQSINKGGSVTLKINTAAGAAYHIEVYRSGYYGGIGGRLYSIVSGLSGTAQPACGNDNTTGLMDCSNWSVSATISTTASWPSGVYLLRLVRDSNGADNHILLVVRDDARASDVLYGAAFANYEAYNNWGGRSLYDYNSNGGNTVAGTPRAVKVSFDRPFEQARTGSLHDWYTKSDQPEVAWLEQLGYDVGYAANTDLERTPGIARNHRAYLSPVHDEYWSAGMRTALEQARDGSPPVGLFFTGANEVYWKIRFENAADGGQDRVEVCYKSVQSGGPDPVTPTTTWRDPVVNRPENALSGEMYVGDNDMANFPFVVSATQGADRIWRYTGLDAQAPGSSTTIGQSLVGWEWDARVANGFEPAGVKTLSGSPVTGNLIQNNGKNSTTGSTISTMTKYTAPSGALVVATGANQWTRGLGRTIDGVGEPDLRIQQATTNVLADMGAQPQTPPSNITLDPTGNGPPAPTGATAQAAGQDSITISWNPVAGATGYYVYRALAPRDRGLPLGARASGGVVTGTTFTDIGLASNTTYYYVVVALSGTSQSAASNESQATTPPSSGTITRINAGGAAYTSVTGASWAADTSFTGGSTFSTTESINGTNDPTLYQNERWGQFSYAIPVPNGTYDVRFHFVELYYTVPCSGKRVFSMDILDTAVSPDLKNIDPCAAVGPRTALMRIVSGVAVTDGTLNIQSVYGAADDPELVALEVVPATTAPDTTITSSPPSTTNQTSATFAFTSSKTGSTFACSLDGAAFVTCASPQSYSGLAAGSHTFAVRATDGGGVTDPTPASYTWTIDTTPPDTTITASPANPTTSTSASFSFTSTETGSTFQCSRDGAAFSACTSPQAYSGLALGSHTFQVRSTDAAGNTDATPASYTWTIQAPAPTVTSTSPASGATGVVTTAKVTATFSRAMDATTITASSFTLNVTGDGAVAGTVSYDSASNTATFTPSAALAGSTSYTATLSTSIKAADGTPLASAVTWSFTTVAPPTVTSTSPASGATGVVTTAKVTATFSRAMDPATITSASFTLNVTGDGAVAGTVSYDSASNTATFTPSALLAYSTSYTATVTTGAKASDGTPLASASTWSFTTGAPPPPPTVTSTSPASGATGVATTAKVTATFSRAMDATTITGSSFTLSVTGDGAVAGAVTYDSASNTATFTPSAALANSTSYTATLSTAIKAADGTPLASPVTWSFTTAAPPPPPTVTSTSPASGATGVATTAKVTATFSRAMDASTITGSTFTLSVTGDGAVAGAVSYDSTSNTATFTPSAALANSTSYTATLSTAIKAADGTPLASPVTWSFTTAAPAPPTVTSRSPAVGATNVPVGTTVTATFSRAMDATTITTSSFTLTKAGDGLVAATVSYNNATNTATLTPSAALVSSTTYTANLDTTIKAADGSPLAAAVNWSFTTAAASTGTTVRINTGGAAYTSASTGAVFSADANFTGGSTYAITGAIAGTSDQALYQNERWGQFDYAIPVTNGTYDVRFHFVELYYTAPCAGKRIFSMDILDTTASPDVPNVDVCALVGPKTALIKTVSGVVVSDGTLNVHSVYGAVDDPELAAIEVIPSGPPPPPVPPTVTSNSPASGATGVATTAMATATFSRAMDPTTITSSSFTLTPSGGSPVAAGVTYDSTSNTATLTPSAQLATSTTYTARLDTTVKASDGTALASAFSWSFTTAAQPPPPTVTSRSPAVGATGVATSAKVTATFSRAMDATTITGSSFTLNVTGDGAVAGTVSYDSTSNTATFTPSAALANSTSYTATLSTAIKAADGTPLASAVTWSFTTASAIPPGGTTVRINAGGGAYTSASTGASFLADANFTGGRTYSTTDAISGTSDPTLYQDERWGQFDYAIPVTNGSYDVRLHFAELYYTAPCAGKRVFSMDILDTPASPDVANIDICALVGPRTALVKTVSGVVVSDGTLNIRSVYGSVDDPELVAVEVVPAA